VQCAAAQLGRIIKPAAKMEDVVFLTRMSTPTQSAAPRISEQFDVLVVGAGHAGCEAAAAKSV
jgi:alkyl hydroperoxide reductase subunit AhpF